MGATRRCALGYSSRSTNIKGNSGGRRATRGRECEEMAERLALERLSPSSKVAMGYGRAGKIIFIIDAIYRISASLALEVFRDAVGTRMRSREME